MAIDVFVMPIWRFKVGDFETQLERLAPGKVVYAAGPTRIGSRQRLTGYFARRKARREVTAIRNAVSSANGHPVQWVDEGPVALSEQLHTESPLMAYKILETWDATKRVVSAVRMRAELESLNQVLRCPDAYQYTESDPLAVVKVTFRRVMNILDVALRNRLPVNVWA